MGSGDSFSHNGLHFLMSSASSVPVRDSLQRAAIKTKVAAMRHSRHWKYEGSELLTQNDDKIDDSYH